PFTPCIAGDTRATAPSATGWAATCGTAARSLRLGWESRATNAGNWGARIQSPSGPQGVEPRAEPVRAARDLEHPGHRCGRAILAAHVDVGVRGGLSHEP